MKDINIIMHTLGVGTVVTYQFLLVYCVLRFDKQIKQRVLGNYCF